jgi:hypothetical protein
MVGNNGVHGSFSSLYRELREASDNGVITISPWWYYDPVVDADEERRQRDDSDGVEVDLE